jgi:hypothetical protein
MIYPIDRFLPSEAKSMQSPFLNVTAEKLPEKKHRIENMTSHYLYNPKWWLGLAAVFFVCFMHAPAAIGEGSPGDEKRDLFRENISCVAERFIGTPYQLGGQLEATGTLDNSHLFCLIYFQAAKKAGLQFTGYMPMKMLLNNMEPVPHRDIKDGDFMVLLNGHAAMLYNVSNPREFDLIYVSLKRKQVISFSTSHLAFSAYWIKNLKGYFRLADSMLLD